MNAVQQLLTDHIDIWTAAETEKKSGRGRVSSSAASVYGIKKLRELILELAVRGKLVPQDASDEPAGELLKRIQITKGKLVADGKIKKDKAMPPVSDEEMPFELPQSWKWIRLNDLLRKIGAGSTPLGGKQVYIDEGIPFLRSQNVWDEGLRLDDVAFIGPETHLKMAGTHVFAGDLLFNITGASIGRCALVPDFFETGNVSQHVTIIRSVSKDILRFLHLVLISRHVQKTVMDVQVGVSREGLSIGKLAQFITPIPPLNEQIRIVAKVDELMVLCDQLEAQHSDAADAHEQLVSHLLGTLTQSQSAEDFNTNWQRITAHFDTLFTTEASIDTLKQTLLQLAVMGKLIAQDANDESASELLKCIEAKKVKLIAEGKIKKNIPPATIADEHQPFSLPLGWTWLRLDDLIPQFQNGASSRGDADGEAVVVLRLADIKDRRIVLDNPRELLISPNLIDKYRLSKDDILIVRVNGSADLVGGFIVCEGDFDGIYCDHFIRMKISQDIMNSRFLGLIGSSALIRKRINDLFITTAGQKTVNQGHISSLLIPVPSIAEQHRIVAKIDELMEMCSELRNSITDANQQQKKLADVLVEHAVTG